MSLRWLTPGLAVVVASLLSCDNQGKGVGTDVVEQLCELNRQVVEVLHSTEGMAQENGADLFTYCDNAIDANGDGIFEAAETQGACKELGPNDLTIVVAECKRNGARIQNRCWQEMESMLACLNTQIEQAGSQLVFLTTNFTCWSDTSGNGSYNGGVYWTWPEDGSRPATDLNHQVTCESTKPKDSTQATFGDTGTQVSCGSHPDAEGNAAPNRCYFMKELPRKGDETLLNNNVGVVTSDHLDPVLNRMVKASNFCTNEHMALNRCAKYSEGFLMQNPVASSGVAGAAAQ